MDEKERTSKVEFERQVCLTPAEKELKEYLKFYGLVPGTYIDTQPNAYIWSGIFGAGGQPVQSSTCGAPPEIPAPASPQELRKSHEDQVVQLMENTPRVRLLMVYKMLNAQGVRVHDVDSEIRKELKAEWKKVNTPKG